MVDRVIQLQPLVRRFGVPALVGMILLALFLDIVLRPEPIGVDFHTYAAASLVGMQTGWAYIYDQNLVTYIQTQIPTRVWTQPFLSPPPVAWMVAPLMALPYAAAFFVWALGILAAFIAALRWSWSASAWPASGRMGSRRTSSISSTCRLRFATARRCRRSRAHLV